MDWKRKEVCITDPNCELRFGDSSWDQKEEALKYTWFNSAGHAARGGEFPIKALGQMIEFAVRCGYKIKFEK